MKLTKKKRKAIHDAFARGRAADLVRGRLIDRLDVGFETGELAELISEWRECLEACGHDPIDLMRAVQNTLFPEAFFAPECLKDVEFSLVPRKGISATSEMQMLAFIRATKKKPKPYSKPAYKLSAAGGNFKAHNIGVKKRESS